MLTLTLSHSLQPFIPRNLHFPLQNCETEREAKQLHALSLKAGSLNHPSVSSRLLALYADPRINNLEYAQSLFDWIQKPTLVSWNLLIKCYIEDQRSNDAIALFCKFLCEFLPDSFTLPCVLKGCSRLGALQEGKQIHGLVLKIGFGVDKFVLSSLVSMYAKCGEIELCRKVFDRMEDRDIVSWNSLIDGYARCGEIELALKLIEEMPEKDSISWTILVDGLSKSGKLEAARDVFDQMPTRNSVSWNAMINGYMKAGEFNTARELFDQMPERNLVTWNSMISGYELNKQFTQALKLLEAMLREDISPNYVTILGALSAASGLVSLGKGRWVHSYIVKNGFRTEGVLGTSLIEMYSKCGSVRSALGVFQSIPEKKLGHWTAIIVGLGMHGLVEQTLELFDEMCRTGLQPHAITFIGVLNACSHAGFAEDAHRYFKMMTDDYGIKPSIEHYGCLIDVLCRAGYLEEAKDTIERMPMKANKVIWMSLLSGSRKHGNIRMGEYAAHHLIDLAPDTTGCYVILSNMYAAAGLWEKVCQVREMMKKKGIRKDPGCSSIEHQGSVHEFIVGDKSHPQTKEIYIKLCEMKEKLSSAGHVPDTTQVLLCLEEDNKKEAELETHSERLAIAFGLLNINHGSPIRIIKNLRICNDCHAVTKLVSHIYNREIIIRDGSRFHHFKSGSCSCKDFW
ncbi:pentatricopeptide repeat-containing protein At5g48910-like [Benincasa hispida]|uniref:pentatricopeptide repeat-containing protein At5g48910-like n=1 Tax=Benincasa hispida TaxID=102211 RepID=UPI001901FF90|nr:pentatricopeptide repeat-containing protein At5g48910-like [Benincasa hispida]